MNKLKLASELLIAAKELLAIEFDTKKEMEKYLKDHPAADKSKHTVKNTKSKGESLSQDDKGVSDALQKPQARKKMVDSLVRLHGPEKTEKYLNKLLLDSGKSGEGMEHSGNIQDALNYLDTKSKKTVPRVKSLSKVKNVLEANKIKEDSDEVNEIINFKKTLGNRIPESKHGQFYVRNEAKLKVDFIKNMKPSNYDSPKEYQAAKKRMQEMSASDFGKILAALSEDDE